MKQHDSTLVLSTALTAMLLLTSCSMLRPDEAEKKETATKDRFEFLKKPTADEKNSKRESIQEENVSPENIVSDNTNSKKLDSLTFPNGKKAESKRTGNQRESRFYDDLILLNGEEEIAVSLVFNSAPILDVLPAFADALGFNFVADSDLKSVVTLNLNAKMTRKELWNTFDRMLFLAGAGVVAEDSLLKIMSLSKLAMQPNGNNIPGSNGEIYYYAFQNSTAKDVVTQLKPFLGKDSVCVELTRPNAVLVCDEQSNMPKLKMLLEAIDQNGRLNWPRMPVKCRYVLPSKLVEELQAVLPVLGFTVTQTSEKTAQPGAIQLVGLDRLQLVVVSAATQEALKEIQQWIDIFDSADSIDQERVFVYKVAHGKAAQLVEALSTIYNTTGSSLTIDTTTGNNKTTNLTTTANRATTSTANTNRNGSSTGSSNTSTKNDISSNLFENPVRVFADGVLNRLVVRTTPRTYASIKALLDRLDVVPSQVLLQVLVVEVTLTEQTQFGIEFSASGSGSVNSLLGTNYTDLSAPFTTQSWTDSTGEPKSKVVQTPMSSTNGFSMLLSNPNNPQEKFGYIKAMAGNTNIKVLSSPQLLVSSHTEAVIQVGERIPVLTQGTSNTASDGTVLQNYQYEDTGVILTVTPQITSTDLISLDVEQTLSSAVKTTSSTIDSPTFSERKIQTSMTIANGRTMIMGGLIQEKKNDYLDTIPFINSIPILRRLFGNTDASVERTELLVLITGYIVNEKSPVEDMIRRYNDAIESINQFDNDLEDRKNKKSHQKRLLNTKEFWE